MPTARDRLGLAVAGNGKLYAIGGVHSGASSATVEEYDPATNTWATKAPMPTARDGLRLAAAVNGQLYAIGGRSSQASLDALATVEEYDPATNTWANKAPMGTARADLGLVAAGNGKLYAVGGAVLENASFTTVEEYNPATNTWATKAPMPTARQRLVGSRKKWQALRNRRRGFRHPRHRTDLRDG
jgi:N-acetylneuraminic acid mutarotase